MKKLFSLLIVGLLLVFLVESVQASPYATCDCTPAADNITGFQFQINAGAWVDIPAVTTCGTGAGAVNCTGTSRTICYDLVVLPNGPFTLHARAKNLWGSSADSLPLSDTKALPTSLSPLKIIQ
jgi:hypothetical protein